MYSHITIVVVISKNEKVHFLLLIASKSEIVNIGVRKRGKEHLIKGILEHLLHPKGQYSYKSSQAG